MSWMMTSLVMGLFGSVHCLAMCGAISGAACAGSVDRAGRGGSLKRVLAYNSGRLFSYAAIGLVCGGWGLAAYALLPSTVTERALRVVSGLAVILAGVSLLGLPLPSLLRGPLHWLWKRVERRMGRLLPIQSTRGAVLLGVAWGLLPCGLLYAALLSAVSLASPLKGAAAMFLFGLGTVPAMVASGFGLERFASSFKRGWVRRMGGALVVVSGVWICWMAVGDLAFESAGHHACCVASRGM